MASGNTRKLIKNYFNFLLGQIPVVENRVVIGDAEPGLALPNIVITVEYDGDLPGDGFMSEFSNTNPRRLKVVFEARDKLFDGSETPLDELCYLIEVEIANQSVLPGFIEDFRLESTNYNIDDSDDLYGKVSLVYGGVII